MKMAKTKIMTKKKAMPYSDEFKASAIAIMRRCGGITAEAKQMIAEMNGGKCPSVSSLHSWLKSQEMAENGGVSVPAKKTKKPAEKKKKRLQAAVPVATIEAAEERLDTLFGDVAKKYLKHALKPEVVGATRGKEAVTAAAVALDKLRLIQGLPTEIIGVIPTILSACQSRGIDASALFNSVLQHVQSVEVIH